jgi:exonuclease SbcD
VRGTLPELRERAGELGDALLRVVVTEPARAGLADDVRATLPNALEVRIERGTDGRDPQSGAQPASPGARTPRQLFHDFCTAEGIADERLDGLFAELLDAATAGER